MKNPKIKLDIKNQKLLSDLQEIYEIDFEEKNIEYCEVFSKNSKSTIYYNPTIVDNDSIAHELLHIWLNTFNYISANILYILSQENVKLKKIFNKKLCDYIGNCMDHIKMYPKYLEMGYSSHKFVTLGINEKSSIEDLRNLKIKNVLKFYNSKEIENYIGNLISIYADHYQNDYSKHIDILKNKDPELFKIITKFWNTWKNFDIENIDCIFNSDVEVMSDFYEDIENWVSNKNVI